VAVKTMFEAVRFEVLSFALYNYSYNDWLSAAEQPTREPDAHGVKATKFAL